MDYGRFTLSKIKRAISSKGVEYTFTRIQKDRYGQLIPSTIDGAEAIKGIFHTGNSYKKVSVSDAAKIIPESTPMILCLFTSSGVLRKEDTVVIENSTYKITDISNVSNMSIVAEISLEGV